VEGATENCGITDSNGCNVLVDVTLSLHNYTCQARDDSTWTASCAYDSSYNVLNLSCNSGYMGCTEEPPNPSPGGGSTTGGV